MEKVTKRKVSGDKVNGLAIVEPTRHGVRLITQVGDFNVNQASVHLNDEQRRELIIALGGTV